MSESLVLWGSFSLLVLIMLSLDMVVLIMLSLDMGVFHRKSHEVSVREALIWTAVWITLAMAFNLFVYIYWLWRLIFLSTSITIRQRHWNFLLRM